jgi:hypothetical protein
MIKTLEAIVRGYLFFRVNDKYFAFYTTAQRYRTTIETGELYFEGYHIVKGWQGFYYRMNNPRIKRSNI